MNMAGVLASPQSRQAVPSRRMPSTARAASSGPESRESRPTPMVSSPGVLPFFSPSHRAKALAMVRVFSGVRVTSSPGTPGRATPRTSLPF